MKTRTMVSFDWAMKRLLRNKANFEVLEGFLSELLRRKIIIRNILESDGNKEDKTDKFNRVDIFVEADDKELVIIELQNDSEDDYFQRMLYGVSKAVVEYIHEKEAYSTIRKVYSINIVYFDLGKGDDYIYHGTTKFKGLHTDNELELTEKQKELYGKVYAHELNPEYYLIKVKNFNDVAKNTLDEWIYFLKNSSVKEGFTAQGLAKAQEVLAFHNLTPEEQADYLRSVEENRIRNSEIITAFTDGEIKGKREGLVEGKAVGLMEGKAVGLMEGEAIGLEKKKKKMDELKEQIVINASRMGMSLKDISTMTGLPTEEIDNILEKHKK
jgi:predicted transposase/invertase (TIGR01784 family)